MIRWQDFKIYNAIFIFNNRIFFQFVNSCLFHVCFNRNGLHVWKEKHIMDHKPVVLKQASNKQELTNWENIIKNHIIFF